MMVDTQVIIDGAVPRTKRERSKVLLDYLKGLAKDTDSVDPLMFEQWDNDIVAKSDDYEFWHEIEEEIVDAIEERLPGTLIVEFGIHTPGDVVVRKEDTE
jgi:hypothetical protein